MYKRTALLLIMLCMFYVMLSQKSTSKKELDLYNKIYGIAIDSFLSSKPLHVFLIDRTYNRHIQEFNFSQQLDKFDSDWIVFLKDADIRKSALPTLKLRQTKSIHTIRLLNSDTLLKIQAEKYQVGKGIEDRFGWIDGWVTISTPIISRNKDKAIVEINYTRDIKDGHGGMLFLEKKNGNWIIVRYVQTWVA